MTLRHCDPESSCGAWVFRSAAVVCAALLVQMGTGSARAQIVAPGQAGVSMGHLHYFVEDVDAHREFWVALGGGIVPLGEETAVSMPGVLIVISEGEFESGGSVIDHVAFRVRSLEDIAARGFALTLLDAFPGIGSIETPAGDRIELFEEGTATNVGFEAEHGNEASAVTERHNRPLVGAIDSHHLHFYLPADQVVPARDWYVRHFGAVPGRRWRYEAADLPGMNLNFSATDSGRVATSNRSLRHLGLEIRDLEAFCRQLEAAGIEFVQPFGRVSPALATAVLTDPWGTTIELTEGLAAY